MGLYGADVTSTATQHDKVGVDFDTLDVCDPLTEYPFLIHLRTDFLNLYQPQYQTWTSPEMSTASLSVLHRFDAHVQDYLFFKELNEEILELMLSAFNDYTRDGHLRRFDWDLFVNSTTNTHMREGLRFCYFQRETE